MRSALRASENGSLGPGDEEWVMAWEGVVGRELQGLDDGESGRIH